MKKTVLLSIIFFFISCSLAFGWVSNRIPIKDRADDPSFATGRSYYYSKDKKPYFIDPDGTTYDLSTGTGGSGGGATEYGADSGVTIGPMPDGTQAIRVIGGTNVSTTVSGGTNGITFTIDASGAAGGGASGASWFGAQGVNDTETAGGTTLWVVGKQGIVTNITKAGAGVTIEAEADGVHSQVTSYVQSQVSGYPYNSQVTGWLTNYTDTSAFSGPTAFITGTTDHSADHADGGDWSLASYFFPINSGATGPILAEMSSGTSDYFWGTNGTTPYWVNPGSVPEAIGLVIGTDVQAYDATTYTPITLSGITTSEGGVTKSGVSNIQLDATGAVYADWTYSGGPSGEDTATLVLDVGTGQIDSTHLADDSVQEAEIDWSSGTTIASAVTKIATFPASNPQDWGGGSASSPFRIGDFPAFLYPNGVYITYISLRNTGLSSQSFTGVLSEWSSGNSVALVEVLTTSGNVLSTDSSVSGPVIEGGNELFFEAISGISEMACTYVFYPR